jgi:hypothetical protein
MMLTAITVMGCSDERDYPPYEVWVEASFQDHRQESDSILAAINEWNDGVQPRGAQAFIFKGFRADSYSNGDAMDNLIQIYRATYDQVDSDGLKDNGDGETVVGLGGPQDDVLIFCDAIAGNRDSAQFDEEQYANYLNAIRRIVLHELGHVLYLNHSEHQEDIMFPYMGAEFLSPGDIDTFCRVNKCN